MKKLSLPEVPQALKARFGEAVPYRRLDAAARDAVIPAERINGRWYIDDADLGVVASAFGLKRGRTARPDRVAA